MFNFFGYNCHEDKEHVEDHAVDKEDTLNIVNFCVSFGIAIPAELHVRLDQAKTKEDSHSAAHEAMDWMICSFIDGTAAPAIVEVFSMVFGKEEPRVEAEAALNKLRGTCKI